MGIKLPANTNLQDSHATVARSLSEIREAVADPFLILERGPQHFMQTLRQSGRWRLERRIGGADAHALAFVSGTKRMMLTDDEVEAALVAYLDRVDEPDWLEWRLIEV